MKKLFPPREPFNAWSHYIGAAGALVFLIVLMVKADNESAAHRLAYFIYGLSVVMMFLSSAIYHSVQVGDMAMKRFRIIDHVMIYVVIAGTYTPVCVIPLEGAWQVGMLTGIWIFAFAGVLKKTVWLHAPRWLSTALYLLMGWVSVLIFPQLWDVLPKGFSYWIAAGGVFYTLGAVIYGTKKPDPVPGVFGFHEIWHLFVMGGAFSHFWAIYYYLPAAG